MTDRQAGGHTHIATESKHTGTDKRLDVDVAVFTYVSFSSSACMS